MLEFQVSEKFWSLKKFRSISLKVLELEKRFFKNVEVKKKLRKNSQKVMELAKF